MPFTRPEGYRSLALQFIAKADGFHGGLFRGQHKSNLVQPSSLITTNCTCRNSKAFKEHLAAQPWNYFVACAQSACNLITRSSLCGYRYRTIIQLVFIFDYTSKAPSGFADYASIICESDRPRKDQGPTMTCPNVILYKKWPLSFERVFSYFWSGQDQEADTILIQEGDKVGFLHPGWVCLGSHVNVCTVQRKIS